MATDSRLPWSRALLCSAALGLALCSPALLAHGEEAGDAADELPAAVEGGVEDADVAAEPESPSDPGTPSDPELDLEDVPVLFARAAWDVSASTAMSSCGTGSPVEVAVTISGVAPEGLSYNYVWERDGWEEWDSNLRSGSYSSSAQASFTPKRPGTYNVYVDVVDASGSTRTVHAGTVAVYESSWSAAGSLSVREAQVGDAVTVTPEVSGASAAGFTYNYVWERDGWADWGSTLRSSGSRTTAASWEFVPSAEGTYQLYIDVVSPAGTMRTVHCGELLVKQKTWGASCGVSRSSVAVGEGVTVTPEVSGASAVGFTYNYVWERDGWADWGSTLRSSGLRTTDTSWDFVPQTSGTYHLYVDVVDMLGTVRTVDAGTVEVSRADWSASVSLSAGQVEVGQAVTVTPQVADVPSGWALEYNYVYNHEGAWLDWGSTMRDQGSMTTDASWQFVPQRTGSYDLYVDVVAPSGERRTVSTKLQAVEAATFNGVSASATSIYAGENVTLSAQLTGSADLFTFNWGWERDGWAEWDSTLKSTGERTKASTATFTPTTPGTYTFFVDAWKADGTPVTHTVSVEVEDPDVVRIEQFQVTLSDGGDAVLFMLPSGSVPKEGAARVAVWADAAGPSSAVWYDLACDDEGIWFVEVPTAGFNGAYTCQVYAKPAKGDWAAYLTQYFELPLTPIMNASVEVDAARLAAAYRRSGFTYPAAAYADKGAPTIEDFCALIVSEAKAEGVDPRILYAQIMIETGGLQYGGDVDAGQMNFGGIGATGNSVEGNSFSSVQEGIRAQVQHLKAYASTESLVNPVVDPRYTYVSHGVMPYLEGLGTRWAATSSYGWDLASYVKTI